MSVTFVVFVVVIIITTITIIHTSWSRNPSLGIKPTKHLLHKNIRIGMFIAGLHSDNPWKSPHSLSTCHTTDHYLLKNEWRYIHRGRKWTPLLNKTCWLQNSISISLKTNLFGRFLHISFKGKVKCGIENGGKIDTRVLILVSSQSRSWRY